MGCSKIPTKIQGFILHFGYAETSSVSPLILRSLRPEGFDSLESAITHLTHYLFEDYVDLHVQNSILNFHDFKEYLMGIPGMTSNFDLSHANAEEWWPWDPVKDLKNTLHNFVEFRESSEDILMEMLDVDLAEKIVTQKKANHRIGLKNLDPNWRLSFERDFIDLKDNTMSNEDVLEMIV